MLAMSPFCEVYTIAYFKIPSVRFFRHFWLSGCPFSLGQASLETTVPMWGGAKSGWMQSLSPHATVAMTTQSLKLVKQGLLVSVAAWTLLQLDEGHLLAETQDRCGQLPSLPSL